MQTGLIESWRTRVLMILMRVQLLFGGAAIVVGAILAARDRVWNVVAVDAAALSMIVVLFLLPERFFRAKTLFTIAVAFVLGVFFTVQFGVFASGPLILLVVPMLTAVFYGLRPAVAAIALIGAVNVAIGFLIVEGSLTWAAMSIDGPRWAILSTVSLALATVISVAVALLLEAVEESSRETRKKEQARAELAEQLQHAQKMEAVGALAGGVAHDFNNLLTVISGFTTFAKEEVNDQPEIAADLDEVLKAVGKAQSLTSQLLAFSKKQPLNPEPVDLNHLVRESHPMMKQLIGEAHPIELNLSDEPCITSIDSNSMVQVLMNLLDNAKRASHTPGPIVVSTEGSASLPHQIFDPEVYDAAPFLCLSVRDHGCGMDEDTMSKAFDPFFTRRPQSDGTGLGLSTCWAIIDAADGHIRLDSELGKGTTVRCFLPHKPEGFALRSGPGSRTGNAARFAENNRFLVMVVEDEVAILRMIGRLLRGAGYRVCEASSGAEALSLMGSADLNVDVLVTDVMMPGMNGKKLADEMLNIDGSIRVLYVSGYSDNLLMQYGALQADVNLMRKPFKNEELLGKVQALIGK